EPAHNSRKFALTGTDGHRTGQLPLQLALVVQVGGSSIVRVERKLMSRGQVSQHMVRANIAAILHGEELIGFDPENSHNRSAVFIPPTLFSKQFSEPRPPFCR